MGNDVSSKKDKSSGSSSETPSSIKFNKNELKVLYKNFVKLDKNQSGHIEPSEFMDVKGLKENPIVQRIVKVFDKNNDGQISFYEFISGLSILTFDGIY
jgi:serine/threonine-protein phosphatase 2B regulatory subunit